ncbi:MAG: hypothetical protein KKA32_10650 [Actinobacteria bacterium]|nr:hypothetical protein [Actinomycetota bacterium]
MVGGAIEVVGGVSVLADVAVLSAPSDCGMVRTVLAMVVEMSLSSVETTAVGAVGVGTAVG